MASSEFMRVVPEAMPLKVYGFKRVSKNELEDIIQRLQKPTHAQETQNGAGELWLAGQQPPRAPFTLCRRSHTPVNDGRFTPSSRPAMSGKTLQKVVRRLQRPTISTMAAEGTVAPSYELDFASRQPILSRSRTPQTAEDQEKLLERIQRPTTASRRKLFGHMQCLLCEDLSRSNVHETMRKLQRNEGATHHTHLRRANTTTPTSGGFNTGFNTNSLNNTTTLNNTNANTTIMSRAHSATHASGGGRHSCSRLPSGTSRVKVTTPSPDLPLISGLGKTSKVEDITSRLHPMTSPGMTSRPTMRTPAATPIAVYG